MTDNGNCQQICNNALPGHVCDCRDGYILNGDGHSCDGKYCVPLTLTTPRSGLEISTQLCFTSSYTFSFFTKDFPSYCKLQIVLSGFYIAIGSLT